MMNATTWIRGTVGVAVLALTGCGGGGGGGGTTAQLVDLVTTAAPSGTTGQPYATTFVAQFPHTPGTYSVVGGALPPGLVLDQDTGALTGYPRTVGRFSFVIAARDGADKDLPPGRDANFAEDRQSYGIQVDRGPPKILPQVIPAAQYRASFGHQIDFAGGTAPYTFVQTGGTLPPGLTVSPSGLLGTFPLAAVQHPYNFQVTLTDANGLTDVANLAVDVVVLPLAIETATLPDASEGFPYDVALTLASAGGGAPYTWGQEPLGAGETALVDLNMQITPTGHIQTLSPAGPPAAGTFKFTIGVTDEAGQHVSRQYTFKVRSSPVIYSISPRISTKPGPFTVTGTKFAPGAQLVFAPGTSGAVTITPNWVNGTTMTFPTAPGLAVAGPVIVRVLNPDGGYYDKTGGMLYPASTISFGTKGFIASGLSSFGLDAADTNGDGLAEIVHAGAANFKPFSSYALTSTAGGVHYLVNNGGLSFTQNLLTSSDVTDVKFVDLDADGDLDIVGVRPTQILTWMNNGSGTMSAGPVSATPSLTGSGGYTSELAIGFINSDAFPDIIYASGNVQSTGQCYAALNSGTGAFTVTASQTTGMGGSFSGINSLTMVKLNADNVWDAVCAVSYNSSGTPVMRYSLMSIGGTFGGWTTAGLNTPSWGGASSIRAGNFLNQTGPCVAVTTVQDPPDSGTVGGQSLNIYYGSTLASVTSLSIPAGVAKSIGVGDFDFDGVDDLAVSSKICVAGGTSAPTGGTPGLVYVYKGATGAQMTTLNIQNGTPTVTVGQAGRVCAGDLDGDGRPDILISTSFWARDNQQSTYYQRSESSDGNPLGIVYYLNTSN